MSPRSELLAGLPVRERLLQLAGIPTTVLEGGDGPPLVLLHGPGEFALTWLRQIPDLVTTHRVILPDLPGHGASELGSGRLDEQRMLSWLDELIQETCSAPPALAGHLLAGSLGARFAAVHTHSLSHLVLVDTFGLAPLRPSPRFALTLIAFLAHPTESSRDRFFRQCFFDMDRLPEQLGPQWEPLMAYALDRARQPDQKAALRSLMPVLGLSAIPRNILSAITATVSLIWGREDRQTPLRIAEIASARYGWPLHVIDGAADDPAFEQPEAFLRALRIAIETETIEEAVQ